MKKRWPYLPLFILLLTFVLLIGKYMTEALSPSPTAKTTATFSATMTATRFDPLEATLQSFLAKSTSQIDTSLLDATPVSSISNSKIVPTPTLEIQTLSSADAAEVQFLLDLRNRWLSGQPCQAPCWSSLVPGETSLAETRDLLTGNGFISAESLETLVDINVNQTTLSWLWTGADYKSAALFSGIDETAILLAIQLDFGPDLLLGDLIGSFGAPTHALLKESSAIRGNTLYLVQTYLIVWIDQGLVVHGVPKDGLNIDAQFEITIIRLFDPGSEALFVIEGSAAGLLLPWHGYDAGSEYRAK